MLRLALCAFLLLLAGCSSPGAFFGALDGPMFSALPSDPQHATVYIYRPQNQWSDEELEAPGLFLNNELIGSLPSNGYFAMSFAPGSYKLQMRRPLLGSFWTCFAGGTLDFTLISGFALEAKAGQVYYLRYDETHTPPKFQHNAGEGAGPLNLVGNELGSREIPATRQVQAPVSIAASGKTVEGPGFFERIGL
ncbi:DUF2846 domain-containing protein [Pseudomonas sp. PSE14]|uniref:DUF2846 domain-containing protein n=1 Tax=Pseudomonas sp. PSE14 TaxID=3016341 RepID=UPI0023D7F0CA|nr:DUF2846 domain-containing protein [Pseudomonas sp. PSE14]WEJ71358.1 DUF2846 domain-containing protein [Pseudomonas sp. PSE14]